MKITGSNRMIKVCMLTSVHPPFDTRIFHKIAKSLVKAGYDVTLVACYDKEDIVDGIRIIPLFKPKKRIVRMTRTVWQAYRKALTIDADIYHLHDPELIPIGLKLKRLGKKVIFDSHEDVPKQLLSKPYLTPMALRMLSSALSLFERYACRRFDGIIAATPFIRDKFLAINLNTVDLNNFPLIRELDSSVTWAEKQDEVCYVGGIGAIRGIREVVHACEFLQSPARLNLAGSFSDPAVAAEVNSYPGWTRVNDLGFLDRAGVLAVLGRSMAGLVTFYPLPNHINAQPNKMFEYMSAGIPVIASNFSLWREIIEGNDCGLCVDPLDPKTIAGAIDHLVMNPNVAHRMGENGCQVVLNKYNWSIEEKKLISFYEALL